MGKTIDTAVILAAGSGIRLRPYTYNIPKGFIQIEDEILIERSLTILQEKGIKNIIIGCGHLSNFYEDIQDKFNFEIYKSEEYASTGSLYTLVLAESIVQSDFLVLESDILYEPRSIDALLEATERNLILASGATQSGDEVYIEATEDMRFVRLSKNLESIDHFSGELVGITKLSHEAFVSLCELVRNDIDCKKWDYERGFNRILGVHDFFVKKIDDLVWCEIDNETHLKRAKNLIFPKLLVGQK